MSQCVVCLQQKKSVGLCDRCCKSYDKAMGKDATVIAIITWAAQRARKFAHRIDFSAAAKHIQKEGKRGW